MFAFAQPPEGRQRGQRPPGMPPGGGPFQGGQGRQFGQGQRPDRQQEQPAGNSQEPQMVTGPGTVPEIWDENPQEEFEIRPLLDRAVIAQPISIKVLRYAEHLIMKYDTNGNGRLEHDEWFGKMSGNPQVIDLNGDGVITLDELVTHIEKFSRWRTIHNPYPLRQLIENRVIPEQKRPEGIFRPLSQPTAARKISESQSIASQPQLTEEELSEEVLSPDEGENENSATKNENEPFQGNKPAAQVRKYAAPTQGLPAWFIQRDLNGDGQVSLYEFCAPGFRDEDLAMFGRLDRNGDGFIAPEELPRQTQQK